jgi:hypothetical protein
MERTQESRSRATQVWRALEDGGGDGGLVMKGRKREGGRVLRDGGGRDLEGACMGDTVNI